MQDSKKQQLKRKIDVLDERIDLNQSLLQQNTKKAQSLFKDKVTITADSEFEGQRIKRRKLGQGAHRKIDDTEEEFLREIVEHRYNFTWT